MKLSNFINSNKGRCEHPLGFNHSVESWDFGKWLTAFIGELGESCNKRKKLFRIEDGIPGNKPGETEESLRADFETELADSFIYLTLLAAREGVDLEEVVRKKFDATSERIGFPYRLTIDGRLRMIHSPYTFISQEDQESNMLPPA